MAGLSFCWDKTVPLLAAMCAALSLISTAVLAEVRVLIEYDNTEHRLLRVVDVPANRSVPISDHLKGKASPALSPTDITSKVKLLWFGFDGQLISTALMDDPRLTHAPFSGADQLPTVIGLDAGAFMVSGPSGSAVLELHMPANVTLGLDQQLWRMMLDL